MTTPSSQQKDINEHICDCLDLYDPKSFFLFAGAGSGKTRALVEAMKRFRAKYGQEFKLSAKRVAVITYTNAACDEIKHRTEYDSIFAVSTIHSFAWELIRPFSADIQEWLENNLRIEISELEKEEKKGRAGTKASSERKSKIEAKQKRLQRLDTIKSFTYNPNGENIGKNSLNHSEVIGIAADFLTNKPLMQRILISKYPFLLIDESQDTQKDLVDAFFTVQRKHSDKFSLSLFGDTMQRIYFDGKADLGKSIPSDWKTFAITTNHRCPKRVVRLINTIRSEVDDQKQESREDAPEGFVRIFLVKEFDGIYRTAVETEIARKMAEITSDDEWIGDSKNVKILTLEHHMAASRGGFADFFEPLYQIQKYKTGLLDGTLSGIPFFSKQIFPLVKSLQNKNSFGVAQVVKDHSPLIYTDILKNSDSSLKEIRKTDAAVKALYSFWDSGKDPLLIDILKEVSGSGLFAIPEVFKPLICFENPFDDDDTSNGFDDQNDINSDIEAWKKALLAPFSQLESYVAYISDKSMFGTHHGIKGLQFQRVMVILDDNEARGFMFSYDRLLGAKPLNTSDYKNISDGKESPIDRTRRLFYVTCSRAQSSLAVVMYSKEPEKISSHLKKMDWFDDEEIISFSPN